MSIMRLHRVLVALLAAIALLTCVIASTKSNLVSSTVQSERPAFYGVSVTHVERSLQTKEDAPQAIDSEERGLNIDAVKNPFGNVHFNIWQKLKNTFKRMFSWLPWMKHNAEATKDASKAVNSAKAPERKIFSDPAQGRDGDGAVASPSNGKVLQSRNIDAHPKVGEQGAKIKETGDEGKAIPQAVAKTNGEKRGTEVDPTKAKTIGEGRGTEVDPTKNNGDGEKFVVKAKAKNGQSEEVSGPAVVHAAGGGKSETIKTSIFPESKVNWGVSKVKAASQAAVKQIIKAHSFANNRFKNLGLTKSEPLPREKTSVAHISVETSKKKVDSNPRTSLFDRFRKKIPKVKFWVSKPKAELPQAELPAARTSVETKKEIGVSDDLTPGSPSGHATNNKPLDTNRKTPMAVEYPESKNVVVAIKKSEVSEHSLSAPHENKDVNGGARLDNVKSTVSEPSSLRRNGDGEAEADLEILPSSPKNKNEGTNLGETEINTFEASKKVHTPPADHVTGHDADGHSPEGVVTSTENRPSG